MKEEHHLMSWITVILCMQSVKRMTVKTMSSSGRRMVYVTGGPGEALPVTACSNVGCTDVPAEGLPFTTLAT